VSLIESQGFPSASSREFMSEDDDDSCHLSLILCSLLSLSLSPLPFLSLSFDLCRQTEKTRGEKRPTIKRREGETLLLLLNNFDGNDQKVLREQTMRRKKYSLSHIHINASLTTREKRRETLIGERFKSQTLRILIDRPSSRDQLKRSFLRSSFCKTKHASIPDLIDRSRSWSILAE
jgi:hypothetical protein